MSKFVRCGQNLTLNRDEVSSVEMEHRHYMMGPSKTTLNITMSNGKRYAIEHGYGVDCYAIEKALVEGEAS